MQLHCDRCKKTIFLVEFTGGNQLITCVECRKHILITPDQMFKLMGPVKPKDAFDTLKINAPVTGLITKWLYEMKKKDGDEQQIEISGEVDDNYEFAGTLQAKSDKALLISGCWYPKPQLDSVVNI